MPEYKKDYAALPVDAALDRDGLVLIAFLRLAPDRITFNWLPAFFNTPIPDPVRKAIVRVLRLHADNLENGETERVMKPLANINDTPGQV